MLYSNKTAQLSDDFSVVALKYEIIDHLNCLNEVSEAPHWKWNEFIEIIDPDLSYQLMLLRFSMDMKPNVRNDDAESKKSAREMWILR
jgi:hypothetical protein